MVRKKQSNKGEKKFSRFVLGIAPVCCCSHNKFSDTMHLDKLQNPLLNRACFCKQFLCSYLPINLLQNPHVQYSTRRLLPERLIRIQNSRKKAHQYKRRRIPPFGYKSKDTHPKVYACSASQFPCVLSPSALLLSSQEFQHQVPLQTRAEK